jgi:Na+/H+ antiporter NhaD/arsenite permease-like protein
MKYQTIMTPLWSALPFVGLLLCIAVLPLATPHFWEHNRNKALVAALLSAPVLAWLVPHKPEAIHHTTLEYISFICLLGSLFTISGGISVTGDLKGTPAVNTVFLVLGALLANLIGTTGASMVLIRPFLRTNSERKNTSHLPVFFIFVVSNCGGLLTPLGDPPLFLGYLRGVPFFWTLKLLPVWLLVISALLILFYLWDNRAYEEETETIVKKDMERVEPIKIAGRRNLLFLGGVLYGVFLPSPWREILMVHMALLSIFLGNKSARKRNNFTWGPIIEVAILFAGIFVTMVPTLMLLEERAAAFGVREPWHFFWLAGGLSSFLDNAPTYLTFLSLAQGLHLQPDVVGVPTKILEAISAGSVFMGANSYIGNGPNFMVKAIADHAGFKTPSFFGYMGYAVRILIPIFLVVTFLFFFR